MKKISIAFFACVLLAVAVQTGFAQSEKDLVIKTARALETTPLDKETINMREKALLWVIETKDVTVGLCGGVMGQFSDKKYKYKGDLISSYSISMAAFKLENPAKASDEKAAQVAGLESALKTYEAILKEKPKAVSESIGALLEKRNNGQLAALVESIDCSSRQD